MDSLFVIDVRSREEYLAGHLDGSTNVPGGQLIQSLFEHVAVIGAKIALVDDDLVRATITASWLIQMGWSDVVVVSITPAVIERDRLALAEGPSPVACHPPEWPNQADAYMAKELISLGNVSVLDFGKSSSYKAGHLPGAMWANRAEARQRLKGVEFNKFVLVTSDDDSISNLAARDLSNWLTESSIFVLAGGNKGWQASGLSLISSDSVFLAEPNDDCDRPHMDPNSSFAAK
jgi:rhodanese-related sulfurtransferase